MWLCIYYQVTDGTGWYLTSMLTRKQEGLFRKANI